MQGEQSLTVLKFVQKCLEEIRPVTLLYVVESLGSSPGRQGFIMAASPGECQGTIGGGIMEFKLVELCRDMMKQEDEQIRLITQYHDKKHKTDHSGMICSGMQRIAIIPMLRIHHSFVVGCISAIAGEMQGQIQITPFGIRINQEVDVHEGLLFESETSWQYHEAIGMRPKLHIVGAGHVSLALSELMSKLGFHVIVYDDRPDLNTYVENTWAHEKHLVDYAEVGSVILNSPHNYIVIMTIGYRTDISVLRQLIDKPHKYLGMLGSEAKVRRVFDELCNEGWTKSQLSKVSAPVGVKIFSQTAYEIAVSIAAEIIEVKNSVPVISGDVIDN